MLADGTQIGPYQIVSVAGVGGMGEVYRAMDPRLHRSVAIKVLPVALAADPDRMRRFDQEARAAAALNHPNILAIYDIGVFEGVQYIVSELLDGATLRQHIDGRALPVRKAIEYAVQIARGLAAAHAKGIVHRDLKPDNIFVTTDGRVKILDFGIAKLTAPGVLAAEASQSTTFAHDTAPGMLLGTVAYMAPEQIRGQPADARADLFACGAILYEMLTGRAAFAGTTAADTITAILNDDPPDLTRSNPRVPPALDRIVRHCLEKSPEQRFQTARDLAFDLDALSDPSGAVSTTAIAAARRRTHVPAWALVPALIVGGLATWAALNLRSRQMPSVPYYQQMTFRKGPVLSARFGPDGRTIIYSANWDGTPFDLYTIQSLNAESREMGQPGTDLLSVSRSGDLAVSVRRRHKEGFTFVGTLARMPLGGGGPRELLDDVEYADWAPNGTDLAIVREVAGRTRLEYPMSTVLYSTSGWISEVRVSPQGDRVAFMDHPFQRDDAGQVKVVDRRGATTALGPIWLSARGLAWSGDEIWFAAAKEGNNRALYAVNAAGAVRPLASGPGLVTLCDVSRDGRALLTRENDRLNLLVHAPGMAGERELSWLDWSRLRGISPDGRQVLFDETGQGGGGREGVYIRPIDGSPAIRLGDGTADGFSPDGKWVISLDVDRSRIVLLPTGAGESRAIDRGPLDRVHRAYWFPDGRRLLIAANEPNHAARLYVQDLSGGAPRPVTPEGTSVEALISPDGRFVATRSPDGQPMVYSIAGGDARPIPGVRPNEAMAQWTQDGGAVLVYDPVHVPVIVDRVDLASGERREVLQVAATNASPLYGLQYLFFTADYREYAYATLHQDSDVYLVEGLK